MVACHLKKSVMGIAHLAVSQEARSRLNRLILCLLVVLLSCARRPLPVPPPVYDKGQVIEGVASWYGKDYHGKPTASGEIYDMYGITAAHKTLPLGTVVQVTRKEKGKSVILKINDRGPFIEGREIDLSFGAAQALDMVNDGLASVQIAILKIPASGAGSIAGDYTLQVGSFSIKTNAESLLQTLRQEYPDVYLTTNETWKAKYYRVRLGRFKSRDSAEELASQLRQKGYVVYLTRGDH